MPEGKRSAVAIRHVAFEDLGLLAPILHADGWSTSYREAPTDDLRDDSAVAQCDPLIVLGGPISVYEAEAYPFIMAEQKVLEARFAAGRPTLEICLGAQMMAKALGARVFAGPTKEIGWGRVTLTAEGHASCLRPTTAGPYSTGMATPSICRPAPPGLLSTRTTTIRRSASARGLWGCSFHLEADPQELERWYVGHAVELATARMSVGATSALSGHLCSQVQQIFAAWLRQLGEP
jgi:GMP synthase (glutamine-hydrolysing)